MEQAEYPDSEEAIKKTSARKPGISQLRKRVDSRTRSVCESLGERELTADEMIYEIHRFINAKEVSI